MWERSSRGWQLQVEPAITDVQLIEMTVDQLIKMIESWTVALELLVSFPSGRPPFTDLR